MNKTSDAAEPMRPLWSHTRYRRFIIIDLVRAAAIALLVVAHGTIYNFRYVTESDLLSLPWPLQAVGMLGLLGGGFVVYSLTINIYMALSRGQASLLPQHIRKIIIAGLLYFFLIGTLQMLVFGRWTLSAYEESNLTIIAEMMRGIDPALKWEKLLGSSGIRTIGFVLATVPAVVYFMFRRSRKLNTTENYQLIVMIGLLLLVLSSARLLFYEWWVEMRSTNPILAGVVSPLLSDPYPVISYGSFGFFGVALGMMLYFKRQALIKKYIVPAGVLCLMVGTLIMLNTEVKLFGASVFAYGRTFAEAGLFLLIGGAITSTAIREKANHRSNRIMKMITPLSRISLTVYMLETLTSEMLRHVWTLFDSSWNTHIELCFALGVFNLAVWIVIAVLWQRYDFKYSMEYFWVRLLAVFGYRSTKVDAASL